MLFYNGRGRQLAAILYPIGNGTTADGPGIRELAWDAAEKRLFTDGAEGDRGLIYRPTAPMPPLDGTGSGAAMPFLATCLLPRLQAHHCQTHLTCAPLNLAKSHSGIAPSVCVWDRLRLVAVLLLLVSGWALEAC